MSARSIFAENLRRACLRYRTIAEICAGIGINRQQFNKYLSGSAMPNPVTLERICRFLNIEAGTLFQSPGHASSSNPAVPKSKSELFGLLVGNPQLDRQVSGLPDGDYFCYSQYPNLPGMVIRSLLHVWSHESTRRFVRVTSFPSPLSDLKRFGGGRHAGIVLANQTEFYFLGVNRFSPGQMSLMTIERANAFNDKFFTGLMLTRSHASSMCVNICLVMQDRHSHKKDLLRKVGLIHESDLHGAPTVLAAIKSMSMA
jgi:transcriptional regulator with XRE-family HTH domain